MRPLRLLIVAVLAIGLSACATLGRQAFATPLVALKDVRVRTIGLDGGALDLVLDVFNPNDYRMDATRLSYTLVADSATVATGAIDKRVTLLNKQHNEVVMPVSFSVKELFGVAEVLLRKGGVEYAVKGDVTMDTPFGSMTRPYAGKAHLDAATMIRR